MQHLPKAWWEAGMSFDTFQNLSTNLLKEGKTTGNDHSEAMLAYAKLNESRQKKWLKVGKLLPEMVLTLKDLSRKIKILVITEAWCGDSGQNLPFIHLMASAVPSKINLKVVLRDADTDIIDTFLTNGGRAIPKAIVLDANTLEILHVWGPRPAGGVALLQHYKANQDTMTKEEFNTQLHTWYAQNKGEAIQREFIDIIQSIK